MAQEGIIAKAIPIVKEAASTGQDGKGNNIADNGDDPPVVLIYDGSIYQIIARKYIENLLYLDLESIMKILTDAALLEILEIGRQFLQVDIELLTTILAAAIRDKWGNEKLAAEILSGAILSSSGPPYTAAPGSPTDTSSGSPAPAPPGSPTDGALYILANI